MDRRHAGIHKRDCERQNGASWRIWSPVSQFLLLVLIQVESWMRGLEGDRRAPMLYSGSGGTGPQVPESGQLNLYACDLNRLLSGIEAK